MVTNKDNQWRVDKTVMISLGAFLFVQTSGAIWWAASISRDVTRATDLATQLRAEAYTRIEASLQIQNRDERLNNIVVRVQEMDTRVREVEKFINQTRQTTGR